MLEPSLLNEYKKLRKQYTPAGESLRRVRYMLVKRQQMLEFAELVTQGKVRFRVEPDDGVSYDDLAGDSYSPEVNPDIPASVLAKQEKEFKQRINTEGVWGIIGEYWNGREWIKADSVWGFVGDDYESSGYAAEVRALTIDEYNKNAYYCICCHQAVPIKENSVTDEA